MNPKETAVTNSKQDNLVQYPLPYKVVDGCLYKEITNKSGNHFNESHARTERNHRRKGVLFLPNAEYVSARLRA